MKNGSKSPKLGTGRGANSLTMVEKLLTEQKQSTKPKVDTGLNSSRKPKTYIKFEHKKEPPAPTSPKKEPSHKIQVKESPRLSPPNPSKSERSVSSKQSSQKKKYISAESVECFVSKIESLFNQEKIRLFRQYQTAITAEAIQSDFADHLRILLLKKKLFMFLKSLLYIKKKKNIRYRIISKVLLCICERALKVELESGIEF